MTNPVPEPAAVETALTPEAADDENRTAAFLERQLLETMPDMDATLRKSLAGLGAAIARKAAKEAKPELEAPPAPLVEKKGEVIPFPVFPDSSRAVVNILARSSLFSAIQGKDRQLVWNKKIAGDGGNEMLWSGQELNQDDHDTLLQLVKMASHQPFGTYVTVPAHAILTGLERGTGGRQHKQLAGEIDRMTKGSVEIDTPKIRYIGHLIDDAAQDKTKRYWVYRINPLLAACYARDAYTLMDWGGRKTLQGKDLARWLQAYFVTHAEPYPVKVETLWRLSGSKAKNLFHFRLRLRKALDDLKGNGDISAWEIDAGDLVHVTRTPSPPQARHLISKMISGRGKGKGRKEKSYES